jgi:hypothetical protein
MTKNTQKIDNLAIESLISSIDKNELDEEKLSSIKEILQTFSDVCMSLAEKRVSIARLKNLLGIKTEKDKSRGCDSDENSKSKKKEQMIQKQKKQETLSQIQMMIHLGK